VTAFRVDVDFYHGPLDLLTVLVRHGEVDVLDLAISEVTRRYVESPELGQALNLDEAGEFLVLVSTLMEYKSIRLLPDAEESPEEDEWAETRQELVKQLLEYRRFREVAAVLAEKAALQQQRLPRQARDGAAMDPSQQPIRELELWDLVSAFSRLMKENVVPVAEELERDPTPLPVYMNRLESMVKDAGVGGVSFRDLLGTRNSKAQIIGKFLAVLELIKRGRVWVEVDAAREEVYFYPPREPAPADDLESSMPMADASVPPDASRAAREGASLEFPVWTSLEEDSPPPDPKRAWEGYEPLEELDEPMD
jgi:segregation and condensation protein A